MDKKTLSKLSYGLYIVASGNREHQNAYIANTVVQVTAAPAKIAVACNKNNFTAQFIHDSQAFSASVLKQNYQLTTMGTFGFRTGRDINKFELCKDFFFGEHTNVPIVLEDCLGWFECKLVDEVDMGTHILFIGEVLDAQITDALETPLTYAYYHEVKKGITAKNAPTFISA